jgi:hypothetical protein
MKNIFKIIQQSGIDTKKQAIEGTFDFEAHLLLNGLVYFTPENFNFESLIREINDFLIKPLKLGTDITQRGEKTVQISFKETKGLKKVIGLKTGFSVLLMKTDLRLWISIVSDEDIKNPVKKEFIQKMTALFEDSHEKQILRFIKEYFFNQYSSTTGFESVEFENRYIEPFPILQQIAFYASCETGEILLAALIVSEITDCKQKYDLAQKTEFLFLLTDRGAFLHGFDQRGNLIFSEDLSGVSIKVKKEIGRNPVYAGETVWLSTRNNDRLFLEIQPITDLFKNYRIRTTAALNFINGNHSYSQKLLKILTKYDNDISDLWSLFYTQYIDEKSDKSNNLNLSEIIKKTAESSGSSEKFLKWMDVWKVDENEKPGIMYLILKSTADKGIKQKISTIHRLIHDDYRRKSKDTLSNVLCSLILARHYADCEMKEQAEKTIIEALDELPDEAICDFIPDTECDSSDFFGGQFLKSELLNLMIKIKGKDNSRDLLKQSALLQPLNLQNLNTFLETTDEQTKKEGQYWIEISTKKLKNVETFDLTENYNPIPRKMYETFLRHPATRKKSSLHWVQNITEKISEPDFSAVKAFSEPLTEISFPEVFHTIHQIRKIFDIPFLEIYIARGDASANITAFDGEPPFLVIGSKILDPLENCGMTLSELKFAAAAQLSNLVFKYSHITSTAEWETWSEESTVTLKMADLFLKSEKAFSSIQKLIRFFEIQHFFENEKSVSDEIYFIESSKQFSKLLQFSPEKDKKHLRNLVVNAICNAVLFTSDRVGLAFTGNLSTAVSSILKSKKKYVEEIRIANETGLNSILFSKNPDGTLKYPELILRIQNLVSFALSFEYKEFRKVILNGK